MATASAAWPALAQSHATCTPPVATGACPKPQSHRRWRRRVMRCADAAGPGGSQSNGCSSGGREEAVEQLLQQQRSSGSMKIGFLREVMQQERDDPWYIGFQTNERNLEWEESASIQMMKLYISQKTGKDVAWVDERLGELVVLLPDIVAKLPVCKADLILALASDTKGVAQRLIALEGVLPGVDLSRLVSRYPALLQEHTAAGVHAKLDALRKVLPEGARPERLVEAEPVLLDVDIGAVLAEIRRLLPGQDEVKVLMRNPSVVLDMSAFKMGSSLQDTQ